jgi:hypothetical protein
LGMVMSRAKVRGWKEVRWEDALGANSTATSAGRRSGREGRRPGRSRVTPYVDGVIRVKRADKDQRKVVK